MQEASIKSSVELCANPTFLSCFPVAVIKQPVKSSGRKKAHLASWLMGTAHHGKEVMLTGESGSWLCMDAWNAGSKGCSALLAGPLFW